MDSWQELTDMVIKTPCGHTIYGYCAANAEDTKLTYQDNMYWRADDMKKLRDGIIPMVAFGPQPTDFTGPTTSRAAYRN